MKFINILLFFILFFVSCKDEGLNQIKQTDYGNIENIKQLDENLYVIKTDKFQIVINRNVFLELHYSSYSGLYIITPSNVTYSPEPLIIKNYQKAGRVISPYGEFLLYYNLEENGDVKLEGFPIYVYKIIKTLNINEEIIINNYNMSEKTKIEIKNNVLNKNEVIADSISQDRSSVVEYKYDYEFNE